jgi:basic membrane protein A
MTFMKTITSATAIIVASAAMVIADPALIYDLGGKFDKSFNEAAWEGAEKWKAETGGNYNEIELQNEAQREQALRRFAENGNNPIVMAGFSFASSLSEIAPDFPDTKFVIIDMVVDAPNVRSTVFKEQEGSYLVGMMAAMASKSGTVGFVGGMDIPLIRRFACGYVLGVRAVNGDAKIIQNYTGTTYHAWNDPIKGGELTKAQISQGADVVYHAAGGTGLGVLQAAADAGILGIGVDKNQNHLQSGSVLTSMVKRVDVAVYNAFTQGANLTTGFEVMGLGNGGVGYSMDSHNASLVSAEMLTAVEAAKAKIIAGDIEIHDAMSDNSCPAS